MGEKKRYITIGKKEYVITDRRSYDDTREKTTKSFIGCMFATILETISTICFLCSFEIVDYFTSIAPITLLSISGGLTIFSVRNLIEIIKAKKALEKIKKEIMD